MVFLRFFKVFCISALFAYVGSWASFWSLLASFGRAFGTISAPSWRTVSPFACQVGFLARLWASKFASWVVFGRPWPLGPPSRPSGSASGLQLRVPGRILGSKLAFWTSFGLPSCPLEQDFDLKVGFLLWLWASKLASCAVFVQVSPPRY